MTSRYDEIDLDAVKTIHIGDRRSKVRVQDFGEPVRGGKAFSRWFDALPDQLAVRRLRSLVRALRHAAGGSGREVVWMIGAHVVKCGLSPYLIELMKKGYMTVLAMNGAALIHDLEIACFGETSEDVPEGLETGTFGFAEETAARCTEAAAAGAAEGLGLGESVGRFILKTDSPHKNVSVLAQAYRCEVPATVHLALGTDILVQHPGFDGAVWGELSARDFRIFARRVECLGRRGGIALNVGSAVVMPEVFLKAFGVARNLGATFGNITTCDMDMISHYRPGENVLKRPMRFGGEAISLTGHHEIMIPLLYSALLS